MAIPALVVPPGLTKQLKVLLDRLEWRDKARLIARYGQIQPSSPPLPDSVDTSKCMVMALLPSGLWPTVDQPISLFTLQNQLQQQQQQQQQQLSDQWPAELNDPTLLKSCYLIWAAASSFATPRHLLAQTPLDRLRQLLSDFLTPILTSLDQPALLTPMLEALPQKWEHYSDFTLLPPNAFLSEPWPQVLHQIIHLDYQQPSPAAKPLSRIQQLEAILQDALQSTHIARKAIIPVQDLLRRPKIRPLAGDWGVHNRFKTFVEDSHLLIEHSPVASLPPSSSCPSREIKESVPGEGTVAPKDIDEDLDFRGAYWAMTSQNHVWYSWAPMFTMFSAGNITEKERVAHSRAIFDARDKVVVDLYAGIGYFTLVYLVHAGARIVHACEWNPWSVEGLCRGATKNGIEWEVTQDSTQVISAPSISLPSTTTTTTAASSSSSHPAPTKPKSTRLGKLQVYPGDNASWIRCFENTAHHVNLGLIPSSEQGWVLAVRALCPIQGGFLHVHQNVRQGEEPEFERRLIDELHRLFDIWKLQQQQGKWDIHVRHVECVKSFAPMVYHYVFDVECRPPQP